MANRHLSRSIAMQTLFEWDFNIDKKLKNADLCLNLNLFHLRSNGLFDNSKYDNRLDSSIKYKVRLIDKKYNTYKVDNSYICLYDNVNIFDSKYGECISKFIHRVGNESSSRYKHQPNQLTNHTNHPTI